jgi:hypothetical protein
MASKGRDSRLTLDQNALVTKARTMGLATAIPIYLEDAELVRLTAIILADVGHNPLSIAGLSLPTGCSSYYDCPLEWFSESTGKADFVPVYLAAQAAVADFDTYFRALTEIHKRRRKYARILSAQPLPTMVQVAPRSLLEFGIIASPALASWMTWRKWFYDIDNRSAQETGYLFEPILASVLGGIAYGARNSPIRRRSDPAKGRQADCIVGKTAYEFKLRVTIAASGQGRFGEELDFAEDCRSCGFRPVLLVLDPTPSHRLDDLAREYARVGGEAFIGDAAWIHLEQEAGPTMATFVEKYVRRPIAEVDKWASNLLDLRIEGDRDDSAFIITLFDQAQQFQWRINRAVDQALSTEETDESIE